MNRRHQSLLNAECVIENLHHWDETVGGATCIRDDFVDFRIKILVVDSVHECGIGSIGWR